MDDRHEVYRIIQSIREVNKTVFYAFWNEEQQKKHDLTAIQFMVLSILNERPLISLSELAEHAHMGCSSMSGVVERLVKAGYVIRERSPENRRSVTLNITSQGNEIMQQVDSMWMERVSPILDIPKEDLESTLNVHRIMISKLTGKG